MIIRTVIGAVSDRCAFFLGAGYAHSYDLVGTKTVSNFGTKEMSDLYSQSTNYESGFSGL